MLVAFSAIFVVDLKIIFPCYFVAPLFLNFNIPNINPFCCAILFQDFSRKVSQ